MNSNELTELLKIFEKRITHLETKNAELERKFVELSAKQAAMSELPPSNPPSNITKLLNEMSALQKLQRKKYTKDEMLEIRKSDLYTVELTDYNVEGYSNIEVITEHAHQEPKNSRDPSFSTPAPLSMSGLGSLSSFSSPTYRTSSSSKVTPTSSSSTPSQRFKTATATAVVVTPEEVSPVRTKNNSSKPTGRIVTLDRGLQSRSLEDNTTNTTPQHPVKLKFDPSKVVGTPSTPPPPSKTEMRYGLMVQIPTDDDTTAAASGAAAADVFVSAGSFAASRILLPTNNTTAENETFVAIQPAVVPEEPLESRSITPPIVDEFAAPSADPENPT